MTLSNIAIAVFVAALLVAVFVWTGRRVPPEYGPGEIVEDGADPTIATTIRRSPAKLAFYQDGRRIGRTKRWGLGDRGIALDVEGDPHQYLLTSDGDWFEETRFRLKADIHLLLLKGDRLLVSAVRLSGAGKGPGKVFSIDGVQGRFNFERLALGKFALRRERRVVGLVSLPLMRGLFDRRTSRSELPGSLPLAMRMFLAVLVELEDGDS